MIRQGLSRDLTPYVPLLYHILPTCQAPLDGLIAL